jgi:hypothetical protein
MNTLLRIILLECAITLLNVSTAIPEPLPEAKLTIKAVDDEGRALKDMPVDIWLSGSIEQAGNTDSNGFFVAQGTCIFKDLPIRIEKQGFYSTSLNYGLHGTKDGKWLPWNPVVTALVRRVINPIPMYAKTVQTEIPVLDAPVGFDLVQGDWVTPREVWGTVYVTHCRVMNRRDIDTPQTIGSSRTPLRINDLKNSGYYVLSS